MWVFAILAIALMSCVQSGVVHCDNGHVCPEGTTCTSFGGCAIPSQTAACDGQADGAFCTYPGVVAGACRAGVCIPAGCGNGVREPNEACDDENTASNDGCSSDCRSSERCGDGALDLAIGEQCDDGNALSRDGCSSACLVEEGRVRVLDPSPPSARRGAALAYDVARERVVLFGGTAPGNAFSDETWEWDGAGWTQVLVAVRPPPRQLAAMAYDPTRGRIVMFGGVGNSALADTWEFDGAGWIQIFPSEAPTARFDHALVFDGVRGRVVMIGGTPPTFEALDDTRELVDGQWIPVATTTALPARSAHAAAFDPVRGELVVVGGKAATVGPVLDDAWALRGDAWVQLPSPPATRANAAAAFDPITQRVLVFGGTSGLAATTATNTLFAWDGTGWTTIAGTAPPPRSQVPAAFDLARRAMIVFGGYLPDFAVSDQTWTWNGSWTNHIPALLPVRNGYQVAWDPDRGRGVLFGGNGSVALLGDTWVWTGAWTQVQPAMTPGARASAMMAWNGSAIVLVGGAPQDTWRFTTDWQPVASGAPADRSGFALAEAPAGALLFGGSTMASELGETWLLGGGWTQPTIAGEVPSPRTLARATYDPVRRRLVLFGGRTGVVFNTEVWEWDGAAWLHPEPPTGVGVRNGGHSLVFDPNRRRSVLLGGSDPTINEWDGATWSLADAVLLANPNQGAVFYDSVRHAMVWVAGGATQIFEWHSATPDEACRANEDRDGDGLAGCDDPDCWPHCTPRCSPGMTCDPAAPRCGDGTCNGALESCISCPSDCTCPAVCGDFQCSAGETCAGDC